jgi:hypothetical protein
VQFEGSLHPSRFTSKGHQRNLVAETRPLLGVRVGVNVIAISPRAHAIRFKEIERGLCRQKSGSDES